MLIGQKFGSSVVHKNTQHENPSPVLVSSADNLCKQFGSRTGLTCIGTVWHSYGIPERQERAWKIAKFKAELRICELLSLLILFF